MAVWAWYTKGRRLPTLIGKDVSGNRIPGGPYTGLQAVTVLVVPSVAWWSRGLWAADMAGLMMLGTIVLVAVAAVKLVGKADFASRNPLLLLRSYLREMVRPAGGLLGGKKVAEARPHRVRDTAETADLPPTVAAVQPEKQRQPERQPDGDAEPTQSSVNQLLEDTQCQPARPDTTPQTVGVPPAGPPESQPSQTVLRPTTSTPSPDPRRSALEDFLNAAKSGAGLEKDAA